MAEFKASALHSKGTVTGAPLSSTRRVKKMTATKKKDTPKLSTAKRLLSRIRVSASPAASSKVAAPARVKIIPLPHQQNWRRPRKSTHVPTSQNDHRHHRSHKHGMGVEQKCGKPDQVPDHTGSGASQRSDDGDPAGDAFQKRPIRIRGNRAVFRRTNPTMLQNSTPAGISSAKPMVSRERMKMDTLDARMSSAEVALGTK